jgi:hypothetical protein
VDKSLLADDTARWLELDPITDAFDLPCIPCVSPPRGVAEKLKEDLSVKYRVTTDHSFPRAQAGSGKLPPSCLSLNARLLPMLASPHATKQFLVQPTEILAGIDLLSAGGLDVVSRTIDLPCFFKSLASSRLRSMVQVVKTHNGLRRDLMGDFGAADIPGMGARYTDLIANVIASEFARALTLVRNLNPRVARFMKDRAALSPSQALPAFVTAFVDDFKLSTDSSLKGLLDEVTNRVLEGFRTPASPEKSSGWSKSVLYIGWIFSVQGPGSHCTMMYYPSGR